MIVTTSTNRENVDVDVQVSDVGMTVNIRPAKWRFDVKSASWGWFVAWVSVWLVSQFAK